MQQTKKREKKILIGLQHLKAPTQVPDIIKPDEKQKVKWKMKSPTY